MDASDIRDEDFNPSNFEDSAQTGVYAEEHDEQEPADDGHDEQSHQQHQDVHGVTDGQLRQAVLRNLAASGVGYHYAVPHNADGQGDMEIGDMNVDQVVVGVNDDMNLVGVNGDEVDEQQPQHLGYDLSAQHQNLAQEQHVYAEPQVSAEYAEEHPTAVLDDHHLSTNQFPNPDMRLPSIPHSSGGYHVNYAEQTHPEHMDINLDIVGELNVETTLSNNHNNAEQDETAEQAENVDHLAMDPNIEVSSESARREPSSGKAPRARHYAPKSSDVTNHVNELAQYGEDLTGISAPSSSRRRATRPGGHKSTLENGDTGAGPSTSVAIDPDQPLSIDEIRRRQARSRASGKVLPRGGACDFCKRRKLRCDGVRPECGHCAKNPNRQCIYSQRKPRTKVELLEYRLAELEQRLGEIGDPLHSGLHDTLTSIRESASLSPLPAPLMDVHSPSQGQVDLEQNGVNDLDQTLHIDPILNQVAQAAEAERQRQQDEQQHEQEDVQHETLRDMEMPDGVEHEQAQQHESLRDSDFNMHSMDDLPPQETVLHHEMAAAAAEDVQQETRVEEHEAPRTYSRSPAPTDNHAGSSVVSRSASIKQLILRLVKGVEDVINEVSSPESKVGEKVVWSLMTMFQERATSYGYTRHINRFASSLIGFGAKPHQCLLYAILGATCLLPYGPYPNEIATYPLKALAPYFLAHAEREISVSTFHSTHHDPSRLVDTIQSCALVAQIKYSEGRLLEGWIMAGQGLKLAITAGLNRISLNDYDGQNPAEVDYESEFSGERRVGDVVEERAVGLAQRDSSRNVSEQQRVLLQLKGYTVILPPALDVAELGERIHLFWSIWSAERVGSLALGYGSSMKDADITTPWPESIDSYSTLVDNPHAIHLRDESVYELLNPTSISQEREDTALTFEVKLLFLLGKASDLLNGLTCFNTRNPARRAQQLSSIQRDSQELAEVFGVMRGGIPADIAAPPVVGGPGSGGSKIRKGFPRDKIWVHALLNTVSMNLELLKSMADPESVDELPDEAAMAYAEFVAKLGKATDPHEHNKVEPAFVVIWHIVGRYLTGRNQVYWNQGRINDAKKVDTTSALVIDTMKSFAKYHHLAALNLERLESIRKHGIYTKEGEWHLSGSESLSGMRQA